MKKFLIMVCALAAGAATALAGNDTPIEAAQLPQEAQRFIQKHFNDVQIAYATEERGLTRSYEVVFDDGSKIEFDNRGQWTEIDCERCVVPDGIVPRQLRHYVARNHAGQKIVAIQQGPRGYEIELSNGLDLRFDRNYQIVDIDD